MNHCITSDYGLIGVKDIALGKIPKAHDKPVCYECKLNKNECLLDKDKICFGPITRGNCNAICPNGGLECWGCRGPTDDANIDEMINILKEKGIEHEHIEDRLKTFMGLKLPKRHEEKQWLNGKSS